MPPAQPPRKINLPGKPHGTHICVPYKPAGNFLLSQNSPAGWGHPALRGNKNTSRGRGGACPARDTTATPTYRVNHLYGFPLRGKLSPQVTDEGATAGHFPLIRRVSRHLPPKGEGFSAATLRQTHQPKKPVHCTGFFHIPSYPIILHNRCPAARPWSNPPA